MKIAQVAPYYAPHHGGVESFVRDLSIKLTQRGHDVTVITSRYEPNLPEAETIGGVRVRRVPLLATLLRTPIPRKLGRVLSEERYDVVHLHTPPPSFAYVAVKKVKRLGMPSAVTYHCDSDIPSRIVSPFVRILDGIVTPSIIRRADRVLVTTKTYSSTSSTVWKITPDVVPVSANTERFYPDGKDRDEMRRKFNLDGKKVVLFVGRLVRHKGVQFLIDAMRYMDDNTVLLVVGDGDYASSLRRNIRVHRLSRKVTMLGDLPDTLLPSMYRVGDVAVVPSTSRLEAFSISAIEAMASGTPVLVSNIPGVREVIEEGEQGLRCEPMDSHDISEKLRSMLSDESMRRRMGESGVKRASKFSSASVADSMLSIYEQMTGSDNTEHNV